ncbi:terpene synthase family protein [Streptomyces sp. URMC 127]|uniref:terpene synthase family protein n=1 Tax=Streptomyces sp. URMC 127 TaxID=3423402 RepID=UPI003F53BF22
MPPVPRFRPPVTELPESFPESAAGRVRRISPYLDEAVAFTDRWVRRTGLIQSFSAQQRFRRAGCAEFAARVAPEAECGRLQRVSAWLVWFHALDDRFHHREEESAYGYDALPDFLPPDGGPVPPPRTALQRALADVWRMTAPSMPPAWRARVAARFGECAAGRRAWDGLATATVPDLVAYACRNELPPAVRELASFQAVTEATDAALTRGGTAREALRSALLRLGQEAPSPAVAAWSRALSLWADGHLAWAPREGRAGESRRLLLADDVTGVPVDLLRPRRPPPPPVPSTSGGAGTALHRGRE